MTDATVTLVYEGPQAAVEVQAPSGGWLTFEHGVPVEGVPAVLAFGGPAQVSVLDGEPLGSELAGLLVQGDYELDELGEQQLVRPYWRVVTASTTSRAAKGTKGAEPAPEDS